MIARVRLLAVLSRPPVLMLLALYTVTGLSITGHEQDPLTLAACLAVVTGFLVFSVALNDLSDAAIDRVNLPGDPRRPLVSGGAAARDMITAAVVSAAVALGAGAALGLPQFAVTATGLLVSAGYSLRPLRMADRGAVAALVLPACYVAVPYLVGLLSGRPVPRTSDWLLLAGLYIGFVGRILLKDFRDVRGDTLFGKRTFLVRHGRKWTCVFSACCWTVGAVLLALAVPRPGPVFVGGTACCLAVALLLLRALADDRGPRRDEALIAAVAIVGRTMILALLADRSMAAARCGALPQAAVLAVLFAVALGQTAAMARSGPTTRKTVPAAWAAEHTEAADAPADHTTGA